MLGCLYHERIEQIIPKPQTTGLIGDYMDDDSIELSLYASSSNESNLDRVRGLDFTTGFRHIIAPALFGMFFGIIFQQYITPDYGWPSPPQGAILASVILSPILYFSLVRDEPTRWYEYTMGLALPGAIFFMVWFSGWGALFCGGYGALLLWVWISTSWGRYDLPPFRYGVWHAFAVDIGAFSGALLVYSIGL